MYISTPEMSYPDLTSIRALFRRHIVWLVMIAVAAPLLMILVLQYNSLVELEQTRPLANKAWMRKYLATVAWKVEDFYKSSAKRMLAIPPGTIDRDKLMRNVSSLAPRFEGHFCKGVRRAFIGYTGKEKNGSYYSVILFYDPKSKAGFVREPGSAQWRAAHEASGHWLYQSMTEMVPESLRPLVSEVDQKNRVITMPILDASSRPIGVAGIIVDESYFRDEVLPRAIRESLGFLSPPPRGRGGDPEGRRR